MTAHVALGERSYDIHVGRGLLARLDEVLTFGQHARRAVVVTQAPIAEHHLATLLGSLESTSLVVDVIEVPDGEVAKSPEELAKLWSLFASLPLGRDDVVIAFGGGVVGDLAGFAAASWNRGVDLVQIPTTVLAQVDSSVGGKTGINLAAGKNLVGAFHQPLAVIADVDVLATLPRRQVVAGLGEVVKYGFIRDPEILGLLESADGEVADDLDLLEVLVRRSVAVKATVVSGDEREAGARAHLNFGHTFGHAVEALTGYAQVQHGEAVAIGMAAALRIGRGLGLTAEGLVERNDAICAKLGLPTRAPVLNRADVWQTMGRDKKARDGVRWALVRDLGDVVVQHADVAVVDVALDAVEDHS